MRKVAGGVAKSAAQTHRHGMRYAVFLCAFVGALFFPLVAGAAIGIEEVTTSNERSAIEVSPFKEGDHQQYDKARKFRFEEQKRSVARGQARGIAMIVAPVVLIVLVTLLFVKARSGEGRRRSTHRKLKQAEVRRRAGGPEQMVDPRQW
jgi:hypothetical protein